MAALRLAPKTGFDAVARVAAVAHALPHPLPVLGRGEEPLAVVGYSARRKRAWVAPGRAWRRIETIASGFPNGHDDQIAAVALGQNITLVWSKATSGASPTANRWYDWWPGDGDPTIGVYNNVASTATPLTDATAGALALGDNVSPALRHMSAAEGFNIGGGSAGAFPLWLFYDRVLAYDSNAFATSTVNMTNTLPATRYIAAGQPGLQLMVTNQLGVLADGTVSDIKYTSIGGTAGRTPRGLPFTTGNLDATTPTFGTDILGQAGNTVGPWLPLQGTDTGAKSVQSYTTTSTTAGLFSIALVKELGVLPGFNQNTVVPSAQDLLRQYARFQRVLDGACIGVALYWPSSNSPATSLHVRLQMVWK